MNDLQSLAKDIARSHVRHVFGIPGSGPSLTLLDALEKEGVTFHLTHFEGTGALMAGAAGCLSGKAGVAISIKGPGLANMVPGLAACYLEAWPVVSLSESYLPGTPSWKSHKRLDHDGMLAKVTKGSRNFSRKGPQFSDLSGWAGHEVPGPVHLNIFDTAIEDDMAVSFGQDRKKDTVSLQRLLEILDKAHRPVVIAGTFSIRQGFSDLLNNLSIPVFSVASAKGVVDETLPHAAGVYTGAGLELAPETVILPKADLVVGIGLRHNEVLQVKHFPCMTVNVDPMGHELYQGFQFDHVFYGDRKAMGSVFSALSNKQWGSDELGRCIDRLRNALLTQAFMPAKVFQMMEHQFGHQCRMVLDTGHFCTIGEHILQIIRPEFYLAAGQSRYMGVGLPAAVGAAVYDPSIPTVAFIGDGGIGMFIAEMKLAVRHRLPLIVVLLSDGFLGSVRIRSIKDGLTEEPVRIHEASWLRAVDALGVPANRAADEKGLEKILTSWDPSHGPLFIEVRFDPEKYQDMVKGLR